MATALARMLRRAVRMQPTVMRFRRDPRFRPDRLNFGFALPLRPIVTSAELTTSDVLHLQRPHVDYPLFSRLRFGHFD